MQNQNLSSEPVHQHRKKITKLDKEIISRIMSLCFKIQNKGIATVFCDYSGHTHQLSIRIFEPVWATDAKPTYSGDIWLSKWAPDVTELEIQAEADQIISDLTAILNKEGK